MKRIFFVAFVFSALLLQGCVMPGAIKKDYSLKDKKIAVVSELGNNFHHNIIGTTVFTNNITTANVGAWKINHLASSHIVDFLSKQNIKASEVETDLFTSIDGSSPYRIGKVMDEVIEKIRPLGFNSMILIRPVTSDNYPFYVPGYGLLTRYFFGNPNTCIYSMFIVELYDFDTSKSVGWQWANAMNGPCLPNSSNDLELKSNFDEYSNQQKDEIRRRTEARVIESLDAALSSMELIH